jgi:hypothetical protein
VVNAKYTSIAEWMNSVLILVIMSISEGHDVAVRAGCVDNILRAPDIVTCIIDPHNTMFVNAIMFEDDGVETARR